MGRAGRASLLRPLLAAVLCQAVLGADARAQQPDASVERQALLEANQTLQEEIALAARPQTYLVVDVARGVLLLKARGVEMHRLAVLAWRASEERPPVGVFRLTARPPVDRPRAKPGEDATEHPIEVGDMPAEYHLVLEPALTVAVAPPGQEHPWLWLRSLLRGWWAKAVSTGSRSWLHLTLPPDGARSLAWSVTEGMPFLIGRTTLPERADKSQATK
jgi:hypothetical protein